jgi:hypothetical protein
MSIETVKEFINLEFQARNSEGEASAVIGGLNITVKVSKVNRKCYDYMSTPTARCYIDGKITKWATIRNALLAI